MPIAYSRSAELLMVLASREALLSGHGAIEPAHVLLGLIGLIDHDPELDVRGNDGAARARELGTERASLRDELARRHIDPDRLRRRLRRALGDGGRAAPGHGLRRAPATRQAFDRAAERAHRKGHAQVDPAGLLDVLLSGDDGPIAVAMERAAPADASPSAPGAGADAAAAGRSLARLSARLRDLRDQLHGQVLGQEHAVQAFVDGLFDAELLAGDEPSEPPAAFVFAGPPGVGKTLLAQSGAQALGRPFERFDMSAYSGHEAGEALVGVHRSYKGAHRGLLTGLVARRPDAVLLFDEIEKAHLNTLQLFLQVLDRGSLEDKYEERQIDFRRTLIIFTTNAGRLLYDRPGGGRGNAYHRRTLLDALARETDPRGTGPVFPAALCSRLAGGYPVLFNRLGFNELVRVAHAELERQAAALARHYHRPVDIHAEVAPCLVLREGEGADARSVRAQARHFLREEVHRFTRLYKPARLERVWTQVERIRVTLDDAMDPPEAVRALLQPAGPPRVLLAADERLTTLWSANLPGFHWTPVHGPDTLAAALATEEFDLMLLDLWIGATPQATVIGVDHAPPAARSLARGQAMLRTLRERQPRLPCLLLSLHDPDRGYRPLDDELVLASRTTGGVRGHIDSGFVSRGAEDWPQARDDLAARLTQAAQGLRRERQAEVLARSHQSLAFDTAPLVDDATLALRLRGLRLTRTPAAGDVAQVLEEVERPELGFADVYGAAGAKQELTSIAAWLRDPADYRRLGLRPPRGVLLHGPPGTGKTLLARALAGESRCAFLVASATDFVTVWQGSGPQNVRELFARARRYAPAIVFIDEVDAIGKRRSGSGRAAEETLNALLVEMDGFRSERSEPVVVVAATNLVELLDEALRRRFDRAVEVDRPDRGARRAFLHARLDAMPGARVTTALADRLAGQSAGMTIADLARLVELAGRRAAASGAPLDDPLLEEAFETERGGEAHQPPDAATLLRVARHEAGHCLVGWLDGQRPVQVSIVARGGNAGLAEREAEEDRVLYTKPELEALIRQAMAGRAAEVLYYGPDAGLSTGAAADLRLATRHALAMVRDYGMDDGIGPLALGPDGLDDGALAEPVSRAARAIVQTQLQRARAVLETQQPALDRLVDALMRSNRLAGAELEALLPPRAGHARGA